MSLHYLVIHGPNLNLLGTREPAVYGSDSLQDINQRLESWADNAGIGLRIIQSNHEGDLVDRNQSERDNIDGIILNPAGLTGVGYSLRDAVEDSGVPTVEVHLSNIHAREAFRSRSVISAVAAGQIVGLKWRGYIAALEILVDMASEAG